MSNKAVAITSARKFLHGVAESRLHGHNPAFATDEEMELKAQGIPMEVWHC